MLGRTLKERAKMRSAITITGQMTDIKAVYNPSDLIRLLQEFYIGCVNVFCTFKTILKQQK